MICKKCEKEIPDGAAFCPWCGKRQTPEKRKTLKRANGTGTVYKLQGRRRRPWVAAKNKAIIGYYETKGAAIEALEEVIGKKPGQKFNLTFQDVFEGWSKEHYKNITEGSQYRYTFAFNIFADLHKTKFRLLRTSDYQNIIDQQVSLGKGYDSTAYYKNLLTMMYRWAIREEVCATNFAQYVTLPKKERKEKAIFTSEEIQALSEDNSEAAKIVLMLIFTGMRIGELFSLPLADYHDTYVVGGEKTEAGRNRIIPIAPPARPHFAHFAALAQKDGLLISGYVGNQTIEGFRNRDYYPLLKRLGIARKTPHATRHTYASRARDAGMKPEVLQKILGHAQFNTTANIYLHVEINQLITAAETSFPLA